MKEPWKKAISNGKVVITLNDEKTTPPSSSEVEVPVDINWSGQVYERKRVNHKGPMLLGILVILIISLITLFKVHNTEFSLNYLTWRLQKLESYASDNKYDLQSIKYKLSIDDEDYDILARVMEPQALIAAKNSKNEQDDNQDLKLSESQNHKLGNSLENDKPEAAALVKNTIIQKKEVQKNTVNEAEELNDARDHPNPADPKELNRPMVENFETNDYKIIQSMLAKLNIFGVPKENIQIFELNKMQESSNDAPQDVDNQKNLDKSLLDLVDNLFRKMPIMFQPPALLQPEQKPKMLEDKMVPPPKPVYSEVKIDHMLPQIDDILKYFMLPRSDENSNSGEQENPNFIFHIRPFASPEDPNSRQADSQENSNQYDMIRSHQEQMQSNQVSDLMKPPMPISNFSPDVRVSYVKGYVNYMPEPAPAEEVAKITIPMQPMLEDKNPLPKVHYSMRIYPDMPSEPMTQTAEQMTYQPKEQESQEQQQQQQPQQEQTSREATRSVKLQPVNAEEKSSWDMQPSAQYAMPIQN